VLVGGMVWLIVAFIIQTGSKNKTWKAYDGAICHGLRRCLMLSDAMVAPQQLLLWATAPHSQHFLHDVRSPLPRIAVYVCADSFAAWVGAVCGVGVGLFTLVSACLLNTGFESPAAAERSAAPPC
jgi:hypothetical protein